ncbi:two-component system response regulator [Arthrobacter sp. Soil782]|uniref:PP2C family protein-serine/threonine phosphatase n=1 Tax=Arthrobacter sp. Soil782 TaxID=1736410 RepID=UPI0006FFDF6B|nr:SpoIIE family protein phosphatase [Arthrobacter sp. Soil782]KRF08328.1 two-component system response regulator [Arthrobacter sp. Soil782]
MTVSPPERRALVIEDDPDIRMLLTSLLKREGFLVTEAGTVREGVEAARRGVDIITLDLNLPDGDGLDACSQIRPISDAYILMITARGSEIDRLQGLDTGADDYIVKPFSPRELVARINSLFRRQNRQLAASTAATEADTNERQRAAQVQQSLLPRHGVELPDYDIAGEFRPSRAVGGDFFDWYPTPEGMHFTVADAMGKGMGAALVAATVRAVLRSTAEEPDLARAFTSAAASLDADLERASSFVTLLHGRLTASDGAVDLIDAGHGLALHVSPDGSWRRLASGGVPLGTVPGWDWEVMSVTLAPGDALAIISDGLLDIYDTLDEFAAAAAGVVAASASSADACGKLLILAEDPRVEDDVTAVVVRRSTGAGA